MISIYFVIWMVKVVYSEYLIRLNSEQPYWIDEFSILDFISKGGDVQRWASWFQYLPLSSIVYSDQLGVLDSNCYHLFSSVEKESNQLNLLHYDCQDLTAMTITKVIQFIGNDNLQYSFETNISIYEYENYWYYFDFIFFPYTNQFQIIIIKDEEVIKDEFLQVVPFPNSRLIQKIGGSFIVENSRLINIEKGRKFASFPGKILPIYCNNKLKDFVASAINFIGSSKLCMCQESPQNNLGDYDFLELSTQIYISKYQNCNSLLFSGWFKIKEIIQNDMIMTYQFIKLSSNYQNSQLQNQNLCPFLLFYKIAEDSKKLIITTYSYSFSSVIFDFTNNPFLITREFDLNHNIQLWHLVYVRLIEDDFYVNIKFFDMRKIYEYSMQMKVRHFHQIYYKLILGNCLQSNLNYLNIMGRNLYLFNCETVFSQQNCHYSCGECDGPTEKDCLSCSQGSLRIYFPDYKQCICPYFTIDDIDCKNYSYFQLEPISIIKQNAECKYGQFEFDGECYDCPGIRNQKAVTCLDCVLNPKGWSKNPVCKQSLQFKQDGSTSRFEEEYKYLWTQYFTFNGIQLEFCEVCVNSNIIDLNNINYDYDAKFQPFQQFNLCNQPYCTICIFSLTGQVCIYCQFWSELINGQCTTFDMGLSDVKNCRTPYYITSNYDCVLCSIINCVYCFEYVFDDLTKSTLYQNFQKFTGDDNLKVGCALCEDGYIFDFQLGECLKKSSKIDTCLRSYINQEGTEICTLSSKQDFSVAKEIINCEQLISNCLQCFITVQSILRCIICKVGYTSTTTEMNGRCFPNKRQYAKISIEGDFFVYDAWMQRIQSFMGSFLPNQYFYPKSNSNFIDEIAISCLEGSEMFQNKTCLKYCQPDCIECELYLTPPQYYCKQCPLDQYKRPSRVQKDGQCLNCSPLCLFCQERSHEEISLIQPNFIVNENNQLYTKKCIQPIFDPSVTLSTQQFIPIYCMDQQCGSHLLYDYEGPCSTYDNSMTNLLITVNINYLNLIGAQSIIIQLQFTPPNTYCDDKKIVIDSNQLKQKIFSLRTTNLTILGNGILYNQTDVDVEINNFEIVNIFNIEFQISNLTFNLLGDPKLRFAMKNVKIMGGKLNQVNKLFNSQQFDSIDLVNITIMDIVLNESSFFKIEFQQLGAQVYINQLLIINSTFINTDLFSITNSQISIEIYNLQIENCTLLNSTILKMKQHQIEAKIPTISRILIRNCQLSYSSIINYDDLTQLQIFNLKILQNTFQNSNFLIFYYNLSLTDANFEDNILNNSILIEALDTNATNDVTFFLEQLSVLNLKLMNSNLIYLTSSSFVKMIIQFSNLILQKVEGIETFNNVQNLFKFIHCFSCSITQVQIINTQDIPIFYFFESNSIIIEGLIFQQNTKKNQIFYCQQADQFNNQLLFIQGFALIKLRLLKINNYQNFNQAFIEILSSPQKLENVSENIEISDSLFQENVIEKVLQKSIISIISIYSKKKQFAIFENLNFLHNFFHQYMDDPTENFAGLIYIDSTQGQININNLYCKENAITNSSTSFLVIISQSIFLYNATVSHHNVISQELWSKFYQFDLGQQYDQDQINQIIQQLYPTYIQGGVAKINCEQFISQNSIYQDILALTSAVFDIKTSGQGLLQFINNTIQSISSIYRYGIDNFGCININSLNSYLYLEVSNTKFLNVYNGMSTVLFSISPSQRKANILLKDIQVINCLSFLNQIMKVQFPQNKDQSQFKLSILNTTLVFEESAWIRYFSQFGAFTEISQINEANVMFNIVGGQVTVEQFVLQGIILSQIFKIENSIQLLIKNVYIIDIFSFYQLPLIFLNQQLNSVVVLEQLIIQRFSIYQFSSIEEEFFYSTPQFVIVECQLQQLPKQDDQRQQNLIIQNIQLLQEESAKIGYPLLQFISSNKKVRFIVNSVKLLQNNCLSCSKGSLLFDLTQFNYIKINGFLCIYNQIKENGCLNFKLNSQNNQNKVMIYNSDFIQNKGSQGGAINAENIALFISNCKIVGNRVTQAGGGIYADINKNYLKINKSIVILNNAKLGGGIYFAKQNNLNEENFFKSVLLFNKADIYANNLVETPTHLSLSINDIDIMSEQQIFGRDTMLMSKIRPYNIIEQGQLLKVKQLMIPSNQKINSYQIYVPKFQIFINYIQIMLISVKNRYNEKLEDLVNASCLVNTAIVYENNHSVSQEKITYNIQLDENEKAFDLSSLSFRFDPYNQEQQLLQIEFKCVFEQNDEQLQYLIYAKALKCQLGEFYVDKGCQICQSNQGFYSVTYNTTKCSIFDKQKFENISSNQIKLQPGYWRPNYLSDYTESCFKNPKFCIGGWDVGNELCTFGHIGGLCEECDNFDLRGKGQFYKNLSDFQCQECNQIWKSIIPFILTSIWAFLQILITLRSIEKSNKLFSSLKIGQKYSKIIFKLNQDHESILIKMLLNYLWIFSVVFNISVSFSFNFFEQTSNTLFVMVNNLDCYLTQIKNIELIYLRLIFMLMLILIQLLIIWAGFAVYAKCKKQLLNRSYISNTLLYLYVSNYAALIKQFCSIISIRQISQVQYIQGDVSLLYGTPNHISWIIFFAIPGLGILGLFIPFSLFFIMYINREHLDNIKLRRHICYLFNEYNSESYFWESIKLSKKTIIIIILTYFESNVYLKASLLGLCLLVYQLAAVKQKPYIISSLNFLDIQTGQICSITLFLAGANYVCQQENYSNLLIPLQVCIVLLCVRLCYPFLINIFRVYFKKYKVPFVQLIYKISRYLKANCFLTDYLNNQLKKLNQREYRLRNNFTKIRCHLISLSKAQLGYQKQYKIIHRQIFSLINSQSTIRFRQTLVDVDMNKLITT